MVKLKRNSVRHRGSKGPGAPFVKVLSHRESAPCEATNSMYLYPRQGYRVALVRGPATKSIAMCQTFKGVYHG